MAEEEENRMAEAHVSVMYFSKARHLVCATAPLASICHDRITVKASLDCVLLPNSSHKAEHQFYLKTDCY